MVKSTNNRWRILTSPASADVAASCLLWNETVWQVADDLKALYFRIPSGAPFEKEIRDILSRLQVANQNAEESLKELRCGHVSH